MGHAVRSDDPRLFQRDRVGAEVLEESHTRPEEQRDDADLDLVQLPGAEQVLDVTAPC